MKRTAPKGIVEHLEFPVSRFDEALMFYRAALGPIGFEEIITVRTAADSECRAGFGRKEYPRLWIVSPSAPVAPVDLAFRVERRDDVDEFQAAALQACGPDNGKPGKAPMSVAIHRAR